MFQDEGQDVELDVDKIADEVDKQTESEETQSEATDDKSSKEDKGTSKDDSEESTSLKTQEKSKEEVVEGDFKGVPKGFANHPAWQKLLSERDEAKQLYGSLQEQIKSYEEVKNRLSGFDIQELENIKGAAKLLKQHPELAKKVQELIDTYPYGDSALKSEIDSVKSQLQNQQIEATLNKYDAMSEKLVSEKGYTGRMATLVKNMLQDTVIKKGLKSLDGVPKVFDNIVKEVEELQREILAGHVKTRQNDKKVPTTIKERDKVLTSKKESAEQEDIVSEIAAGLKADRAEIQTEE